jgi:hypothetical protein
MSHLEPTSNDRGFKSLPSIAATHGDSMEVYESSNAEGPHLWLKVRGTHENGGANGEQVATAVQLTAESAQQLAQQLAWLLEHHYQGDARVFPAPASSNAPDVRHILALPMDANDAGATTIGDYLRKLSSEVWRENEGFDGKRPFGDSGWEYVVYAALAKGGAIKASFDDAGDLEYFDTDVAHALVQTAIDAATLIGG